MPLSHSGITYALVSGARTLLINSSRLSPLLFRSRVIQSARRVHAMADKVAMQQQTAAAQQLIRRRVDNVIKSPEDAREYR
jgi:hypothetical protein